MNLFHLFVLLCRYAVCEDLPALLPVLHDTVTVARETSGALQRGATGGDVPKEVPHLQDHDPGTQEDRVCCCILVCIVWTSHLFNFNCLE